MNTMILQGNRLTPERAETIANPLGATIEAGSVYTRLTLPSPIDRESLAALRDQYDFDINVLPSDFRPEEVGLLVTDMDSTLINIECVDEIADFLGIKDQVAEITEAAMRGELDFETSLARRVNLLRDLDTSALEHVYNERLQLNPGAEQMLAGLQRRRIKTALVSGGFTFFTDRLQERLDLDYTLANVLEINGNHLTGKVKGEIIGGKAKAELLEQLRRELDLSPSQTVAMGDGANDLPMMEIAGLSIAYHAKPKVQQQADAVLNHCGLEGVLGLLQI